ncbi:MAG: bestrophin family protein [Bacteroidia bacterium]|jgi:putative membrane protein
MRSYNTKNWLEVFTFYKQDTLRMIWPMIVLIAIYTSGVDYWLSSKPEITGSPVMKNLTIMHSLLGLVISLLLVFRTNTAYDRWWEGRKLWGALVNNSRNLAMKLQALLPAEQIKHRNFFRKAIPLFAQALDKHLKSPELEMSLDDHEHLELNALNLKGHVPNQIATVIIKRCYELEKQGIISQTQLLTLNPEISALSDICGACERIKNTPIPFSYASFIKRFIILYIFTLPWSLASNLGFWSVPVVAFVFYALSSLEVIAEEIEEPFGTDPNDLPTDKIAGTIGKNIHDIIIPHH